MFCGRLASSTALREQMSQQGPPAQTPPLRREPSRILDDKLLVPGGGIPVHVLVIVVEPEEPAQGLDPPAARGQAVVAADFGAAGRMSGCRLS